MAQVILVAQVIIMAPVSLVAQVILGLELEFRLGSGKLKGNFLLSQELRKWNMAGKMF